MLAIVHAIGGNLSHGVAYCKQIRPLVTAQKVMRQKAVCAHADLARSVLHTSRRFGAGSGNSTVVSSDSGIKAA